MTTLTKPKKKLLLRTLKVGRPSKKDALDVEIAQRLAEIGHTLREIADILGVDESNLFRWCKYDKKFRKALSRGSEQPNIRVVNSLYLRACGYDYEEVTKSLRKVVDIDPETLEEKERMEMVVVKTVTKHVQGDFTAQAFWTKNKMPDEWRDKANGNGGDTYITTIIDSIVAAGDKTSEGVAHERARACMGILAETLR